MKTLVGSGLGVRPNCESLTGLSRCLKNHKILNPARSGLAASLRQLLWSLFREVFRRHEAAAAPGFQVLKHACRQPGGGDEADDHVATVDRILRLPHLDLLPNQRRLLA